MRNPKNYAIKKAKTVVTFICFFTFLITCFSLLGCSQKVAGVINSGAIPETTFNSFVENKQQAYDVTTDEWNQLLSEQGFTKEEYRYTVIKEVLIPQQLAEQLSKSKNLKINNKEIDQQIEQTTREHGGQELFNLWLKDNGYTEKSFREELEYLALVEDINQCYRDEASKKQTTRLLSTSERETYFNATAKSYNGKRSSAIEFDTNEKELAEKLAAELKNSNDVAQDFYLSAQRHNKEIKDMGWVPLTILPGKYIEELDKLQVNQTSDAVEINGSFYLILCTDEFYMSSNNSVNIDEIPGEIVTAIDEQFNAQNAAQDEGDYFKAYMISSDIVIYDENNEVAWSQNDKKHETSETYLENESHKFDQVPF